MASEIYHVRAATPKPLPGARGSVFDSTSGREAQRKFPISDPDWKRLKCFSKRELPLGIEPQLIRIRGLPSWVATGMWIGTPSVAREFAMGSCRAYEFGAPFGKTVQAGSRHRAGARVRMSSNPSSLTGCSGTTPKQQFAPTREIDYGRAFKQ